jgi:hypothetical protein
MNVWVIWAVSAVLTANSYWSYCTVALPQETWFHHNVQATKAFPGGTHCDSWVGGRRIGNSEAVPLSFEPLHCFTVNFWHFISGCLHPYSPLLYKKFWNYYRPQNLGIVSRYQITGPQLWYMKQCVGYSWYYNSETYTQKHQWCHTDAQCMCSNNICHSLKILSKYLRYLMEVIFVPMLSGTLICIIWNK